MVPTPVSPHHPSSILDNLHRQTRPCRQPDSINHQTRLLTRVRCLFSRPIGVSSCARNVLLGELGSRAIEAMDDIDDATSTACLSDVGSRVGDLKNDGDEDACFDPDIDEDYISGLTILRTQCCRLCARSLALSSLETPF
jgi:hypothetical protein